MSSLADICRTIADGTDAAWDDAPEVFREVLKAASDTLAEAAVEIERLQPIQDAAKRLKTQSKKHTMGCSWMCANMLRLFGTLDAAEAARENHE